MSVALDAIVQEITIEAPASRVFEALTNPAQRVRWWGLKGKFGADFMASDLRPGGAWSMLGTRGDDPFLVEGEYQEVDPPRLLVFTWRTEPTTGGETLVRIELDEREGQTHVRLTHSGFGTAEERGFYRGWAYLLGALRGYVQDRSETEIA